MGNFRSRVGASATIDVGEHFVKATYFLEGDGPLIFSRYEKLSAVNQACQAPHYSNVHSIATAIAREDPGQNVAEHLNGGRKLVLNRQLHDSRGSSMSTCVIY